MFRPSSAFCKSLWCRAGCPKNFVALGAGVGLLDGSLRKWRSIKTPRPHPKAPRASHWYGGHRQGCAGTTLAARARQRLCWHCLCFFIAKNPWSAGRRSFVAASSKNTEVDSRVGALWLYVCRRVNRHALATPMRRPLPIAEGIRLALRLDTLVPKMTRPKCGSRLVSLTPGGGRL